MAQPTLAFGTATVTLPYPSATAEPTRTYAELGGSRRTVAGNLRRWTSAYWYEYRATWEYCDRTTYDAVVSLVRTAIASNGHPTFTWSAGPWLTAVSGVEVAVTVSPMRPGGPLYAYVNFDLEMAETGARTS